MEIYKLEVKDGILTDIDTIRTIPGEYEEVNGDLIPKTELISGKLYITKDITGITNDALVFVDAEYIDADPENPVFYAKDNCLITKNGGKLVLTCKNSVIPNNGSIKIIGNTAYQTREDYSDMDFNPYIIPDGVKELEYRALAICSENPIHFILPESLEKISLMSLMVHGRNKVTHFTINGNPEIEVGAFGTKGESKDSSLEVYKSLPDIIYCKNNLIMVHCKAGTKVLSYCNKYNIPCEIIK